MQTALREPNDLERHVERAEPRIRAFAEMEEAKELNAEAEQKKTVSRGVRRPE